MSHVDLGFAEISTQHWRLESPQFPSKIGGQPAWLSLSKLPLVSDLLCAICNNPKTFLCQIYAPFEECAQNFHRSLFIFVCKTQSCSKKNDNRNLTVLRSNLARRNDFYSFDPPLDQSTPFNVSKWTQLCALCGCRAEKTCCKCKTANYCSRTHQVIHWKECHKNICGTDEDMKKENVSMHLFDEFEIVIEPEEIEERREVNIDDEIKELEALQVSGKAGSLAHLPTDDDLDRHAAIDGDKSFTRFRKRVAHNPQQILRYERGGEPLWIAKEPIPTLASIPHCEHCMSVRRFEFQIMPQLLAVLKVADSIDFGVLAVYTCTKSCWATDGYKKEFVFKQDVME